MTTIVKLAAEAWEDLEDDAEALLDEWLVSEGDTVSAGQVLANVMLIKTTHEISAPVDGTVVKLLVAEEDSFGRDQPLAEIE
ncbi:lipoyl domain-containing protein [Pseudohalioglobus lutimaris]|uniref:Biotin attachment protein n=1 Tax=Pseudohalioglobus lutimaris TaxID=1737061 RepID=A0A2N5X5U1_9GAMM|nr:lipoyl domain-containing protein [Pseudohalioglobus lutimaris]PLW69854.1 biotin attachment protein [Pseudohalioglobus lutimaris]